jgi:hypothetical protein
MIGEPEDRDALPEPTLTDESDCLLWRELVAVEPREERRARE